MSQYHLLQQNHQNLLGRLWEEWLTPLISRDIMLLLRNGEFASALPNGQLPPEMQGQAFKPEYLGRLAMELKSQQSRGFQQWVGAGIEMNAVFPVTDNIDFDGGYRRLGETLGVSVEDMASVEDRETIREQRQAELEAQQAAEQAAALAQGYGQTTKAPEEGSLAGAVTGASI